MTDFSTLKKRRIFALSFNAEEQEQIEVLMRAGGHKSFSDFAKARIFGEASQLAKHIYALEDVVENLAKGYENQHRDWIKTVNAVTKIDSEPLIAAIYWLLHSGASFADKAPLERHIDLALVKKTAMELNHNYRPPPVADNPYQRGKQSA